MISLLREDWTNFQVLKDLRLQLEREGRRELILLHGVGRRPGGRHKRYEHIWAVFQNREGEFVLAGCFSSHLGAKRTLMNAGWQIRRMGGRLVFHAGVKRLSPEALLNLTELPDRLQGLMAAVQEVGFAFEYAARTARELRASMDRLEAASVPVSV
jgi:hypothetical protein